MNFEKILSAFIKILAEQEGVKISYQIIKKDEVEEAVS